jgi:hypothetical protein
MEKGISKGGRRLAAESADVQICPDLSLFVDFFGEILLQSGKKRTQGNFWVGFLCLDIGTEACRAKDWGDRNDNGAGYAKRIPLLSDITPQMIT